MAVRLARQRDAVRVGAHFTVAFQRTLRIPEDGRVYPLPPGLGRLPIVPVDELSGPGSEALRIGGGFVVPLSQREALWLAFGGAWWRPSAVQVTAGGVNAVDGGPWTAGLVGAPQNYIVCPDQPWLDGVKVGGGQVRQFVALPLNDARTIEAQVLGRGDLGGVQLRVYAPKPGRFPDAKPPGSTPSRQRSSGGLMGLGVGGRIAQRIYPDPYGLDTWDPQTAVTVQFHILNSLEFAALTNQPAPPSPITAETYARCGLPWFELYDERRGDIAPTPTLAKLIPTGGPDETERRAEIREEAVQPIRRRGHRASRRRR